MSGSFSKRAKPLLQVVNGVLVIMLFASIAFLVADEGEVKAATPFGGLSTQIFYCTCSGGIAVRVNDLMVSPPVTLPLIYRPGSTTLFQFGQIYRTGVWTLGLWSPGGVCTYFAGKGCAVYPTAGTMVMVGTSM